MFVLLQYAINEFLHKNHNCFYVNISLLQTTFWHWNFNMLYKYILSISLVLLPLAIALQNGDSFGDGKISTLHISKFIFWLVNTWITSVSVKVNIAVGKEKYGDSRSHKKEGKDILVICLNDQHLIIIDQGKHPKEPCQILLVVLV